MRAAIIGAGITGLASALFLLREGVLVTLIDPVTPGAPEQTSYGNAGLIAISAVTPLSSTTPARDLAAAFLNRDSPIFLRPWHLWGLRRFGLGFLRAGWRDPAPVIEAMTTLIAGGVADHLALDVPEAAALIQHGAVGYVYDDASHFAHARHGFERRAAAGFNLRILSGGLDEIDADLSARFTHAAVFDDHAWIVDPGAYMAALATEISRLGGEFVPARAVAIKDNGVETAQGWVAADRVVLTAGAQSAHLLWDLGMRVPLIAERGYHRFYHGVNIAPKHPYLYYDAAIAITPMQGGARAAGLVEFAPYEAPMRRAPLDYIDEKMRLLYPNLRYDRVSEWLGRRPTLPDSLPVIARQGRLIMAFGGQHLGLTMGPRLGMLARDLVLDRRMNIDLAPYDWRRFGAARPAP